IIYTDKVYIVYLNIDCTRCKFFANAIKFGGKETEHNTISFPKDDPLNITLLLDYLYEGNYAYITSAQIHAMVHATNPTFPHDGFDVPQCEPFKDKIQIYFYHTCGGSCDWGYRRYIRVECIELYMDLKIMLVHSQMYALGDKYFAPGLKSLAMEI
ncbi:hypothetical protein B0J11DRAFT_429525, partial [Dendryphion nanum]